MASIPIKTMIAYTDGGSRGNPGDSAIGIVLMDTAHGGKVTRHKQYIGKATNNVAEYTALLMAVQLAVAYGVNNLFVNSDSELMVKQVKGLYTVRDAKLKEIYDKIIKLLPKFEAFTINYVPREKNKEADKLVNQALDEHQGKNGN